MISKAEMNIEGMTIHELADKLSVLGAELLVKTIPEIVNGTAVYTPQNEEEHTYASMIQKEDGRTDFSGDAVSEERKIRAYDPWPALYSFLGGKQIKFFRAEVLEEEGTHDGGVISAMDKKSFTVDCGKGKLRILEVQLQGKKRMSAGDFLRGAGVSVGDRLTKGE